MQLKQQQGRRLVTSARTGQHKHSLKQSILWHAHTVPPLHHAHQPISPSQAHSVYCAPAAYAAYTLSQVQAPCQLCARAYSM